MIEYHFNKLIRASMFVISFHLTALIEVPGQCNLIDFLGQCQCQVYNNFNKINGNVLVNKLLSLLIISKLNFCFTKIINWSN